MGWLWLRLVESSVELRLFSIVETISGEGVVTRFRDDDDGITIIIVTVWLKVLG